MSQYSSDDSSFTSSTGEILADISGTGKHRKWMHYKQQSLAVADAYHFFEYLSQYGVKIADCGAWLRFNTCPQGHMKRLINASFCKCRLCVLCQWRKSLVMFHQTFELIHAHRKQASSDVPLLLTLTVPNVASQDLPTCLDNMAKAWHKLIRRQNVRSAVRAWFRGLEVTYNSKVNTYHPHFHALLMVSKNYFDVNRTAYIPRDEWLSMWQEVTGIPEITQVDIRTIKKRSKYDSLASASAEVSKYATKPSSYLEGSDKIGFKAPPAVIEALHHSLKGRRLTAYGGLFKQLRRDLKQADIEQANLIAISDDPTPCQCPICQSNLREEMYRWHVGFKEYIG